MSDLFHEKVSFSYIERVFDVIKQAHHPTFQILTKRAERLAAFCRRRTVPPNPWLGVFVENRKYGLPRIDVAKLLRQRRPFSHNLDPMPTFATVARRAVPRQPVLGAVRKKRRGPNLARDRS